MEQKYLVEGYQYIKSKEPTMRESIGGGQALRRAITGEQGNCWFIKASPQVIVTLIPLDKTDSGRKRVDIYQQISQNIYGKVGKKIVTKIFEALPEIVTLSDNKLKEIPDTIRKVTEYE
ncbi:MAG: hypothetical protein Q4A30_00240 [Candidatus Saccharibacteria bacterium]|nr:hypothetical protein [Candidatus Saccharibacteria bacterium]